MSRRRSPKARNKNKNKKKGGEEIISEFKDAVSALKYRYKTDFPDLVLFLHFNAFGKNIIFQRIQSFPLRSMTYRSSSYTVMFNAEWVSNGALPYLLPKFDIDLKESGKEVEWEDVEQFSITSRDGGSVLRSGRWVAIEEADDIDSSIDIRIDEVKSINMYGWGFELMGEVISIFAVNKNVVSPSFDKYLSINISNLSFDFGRLIGDNESVVRWVQRGYSPEKQKVSDFDKMLFSDSKDVDKKEDEESKIMNIGQRCMKNIILDNEVSK